MENRDRRMIINGKKQTQLVEDGRKEWIDACEIILLKLMLVTDQPVTNHIIG